jgi:ABC-type dipeptide/oligopeptide/nickel transport system ATPase component
MEPVVLICDESTSALDAGTRDGILRLLRDLKEDKSLALILISHDEYLIRHMADDIMVMAAGQVVEQGNAKEIISYPTHPVTKKVFSPVQP